MSPSAVGTFATTPLHHSLVFAKNRRLGGRLDVAVGAGATASICFSEGAISRIDASSPGVFPGLFFGTVAYELGHLDLDTLNASLAEVARTRRLHGELLVERGALRPETRATILVEQTYRKLQQLLALPPATPFAYYDATTVPHPTGVLVDVVGAVWRGLAERPPVDLVADAIRRMGALPLRVVPGAAFELPPRERALLDRLAVAPQTIEELVGATELPRARVELLVYLLAIAKCVEVFRSLPPAAPRATPAVAFTPVGGVPAVAPSAARPPSQELRAAPAARPATPSRQFAVATPWEPFTPVGAPRPPAPSSARMPAASPAPSGMRVPTPPGSSPSVTMRRATPTEQAPASTRIPTQVPGSGRKVTASFGTTRTPAEYGVDGIVARAATVEREELFAVLGLPEGATVEEVKGAYQRLARTWEPDKIPADFQKIRRQIGQIFEHMTRAHRILCEPEDRRIYLGLRDAAMRRLVRPREELERDLDIALARKSFSLAAAAADELLRTYGDAPAVIAKRILATTRNLESSEEEVRVALVQLERAARMVPTSPEAAFVRGLAHKRLGNLPAALRDFAQVQELEPGHAGAERELKVLAVRGRRSTGEFR